MGGKVGSSAARLVGREQPQRTNFGAPRRAGKKTHACRIHKVHRSNSYCGKRKRARRLSCRASVTRLCVGAGKSFAKFREKFASGAAGAEISRNLPLTVPLASPRHTQYTCTG